MEVYEKIRLIRTLKGWTQEEMAEKLGMALHGYAKIERGEVDINLTRLKQIVETLGIELAQLIGFNENTVFNLMEIGSNHSRVTSGNNCHVEYSECNKHQLEKTLLLLEQRDKEIALLNQQISDLREMNSLLKQSQSK